MVKKIVFYPQIYKLHTSYKTLLTDPPKGYVFINPPNRNNLISKLKKVYLLPPLYKLFTKIFKTDFLQRSVHKFFAGEQEGDFLFSTGVLYYGEKPWILDIIDNPYCMTGYNYALFLKNKSIIESILLRENCKAIICANESSFNLMKKHFSKKVLRKTFLVEPAVKEIKLNRRKKKKDYFRLLFIGSITNPDDFYIKGGLEALNVFRYLSKKHQNLQIVIRCKLPNTVYRRIKNFRDPRIITIQKRISYRDLLNLYLNSDIFLFPGHTYPLMVFLESMSFGIPIVALDTYAVRDYVVDKKNGFIIKPSTKIPYSDESYPTNIRTRRFINAIKKGDKRVIKDLSKKVEILIKNEKIRKKMNRESKRIIFKKFSINKRNKKLKKLFDSVL